MAVMRVTKEGDMNLFHDLPRTTHDDRYSWIRARTKMTVCLYGLHCELVSMMFIQEEPTECELIECTKINENSWRYQVPDY